MLYMYENRFTVIVHLHLWFKINVYVGKLDCMTFVCVTSYNDFNFQKAGQIKA